jgi:hypothetical protein
MSLAEKMLKKMGWREGEGLGKHKQGIATPLVAQKVAAGAGVIVAASEMAPPEKRQRTGAVLQVGGGAWCRARRLVLLCHLYRSGADASGCQVCSSCRFVVHMQLP